ncbi:MAG: PIG-L family deacetylase [Acidimicrobiaceae bacterium]|nr:PIG-L family deacetylase [Acidimicrobiaceae bacterium]
MPVDPTPDDALRGLAASLGTILSIWAHPDDETYLAGGLMAAARDNGQRVVCVSATAGEHGTSDPATWPPDRLGRIRRWEAAAAMAILGVGEHRFLDFEDGTLTGDDETAIALVEALIDEVRPDTILTFGADGMTFHPDHIAVHHWVLAAWERRGGGARLLHAAVTDVFLDEFAAQFEEWNMYMTEERPTGVPIDELAVHTRLEGEYLDRKVAALQAMVTQTAGLLAILDLDTYAVQVAEEAFALAVRPPAATP